MLESIPFSLLIGTILGFLSGLGVGGGSLLILWLTQIIGMSYAPARIINLMFFLPTAIIASIYRKKEGTLKLKKLFPGIIAGCIAAAAASMIGANLDTGLIKKLFGFLLLLAGCRELFYHQRRRKAK